MERGPVDHVPFKTMDLTLAPGILEQLIQHARNAYPHEACGLLVGRNAAERFIPISNISAHAREYEMDPGQLIATLRALRDTGEELLAIFHSHPHGPAVPSKRDIERAYYPEAVHLIVSLARPERPEAVAFRIADGEALPIQLNAMV